MGLVVTTLHCITATEYIIANRSSVPSQQWCCSCIRYSTQWTSSRKNRPKIGKINYYCPFIKIGHTSFLPKGYGKVPSMGTIVAAAKTKELQLQPVQHTVDQQQEKSPKNRKNQ